MKIISFYSDKGGAGKSFLTMWVASILKYKFDKRVVVVDTIAGYENLSCKRKEDIRQLNDNFAVSDNDFIEIRQINQFEQFLDFCKEKEYEYDYIFADTGAINEVNMYILMKCNYIFIVTDQDFEKRMKIYESFKNMIGRYEGFNIEDVRFIFNKVEDNINEEDLSSRILAIKDGGGEDITLKDFILPAICTNKKRGLQFDTLSVGRGNIPADLMSLAENIMNLTNENIE